MNIEIKAPGGFGVELKDFQIKKPQINFDKIIDVSKISEIKNNLQEAFNPDKRVENLYSSYKERIEHVPKENSESGKWTGERGESKFIPSDASAKKTLEKYNTDGIEYKNGMPDFSPVSEATVRIDNMTESRPNNFRQCDIKCAEQWNSEARNGKTDWSARDIANFRSENHYSWHERNDTKTCDLVPFDVHQACTHLGGVSECKKRDNVNGGGFDA